MLLWPYAPLVGVGIVLLSHALLVYPTLRPNVQWFGPVATRFATSKRELWLTVDDGPTPDTVAVLDLFDARDVKATFFVKGVLASARGDLVHEILRRGHTIGNHSQTHPSGTFWCLPPGRIAGEIDGCNEVLQRLTGAAPRWFRAPVGMKNPGVHPALARRGMRLVGWTARGYDGVPSDPDRVVPRVVPDLAPGAIVLLHQGQEHSLEILDRVIAAAREQGYSFVIPDDAQLLC